MEISYGGLVFQVINIDSFERSPVMDDSGTDYLFTQFKGSILAIINNQAVNDFVIGATPATVGMAYARVAGAAGPPINTARVDFAAVPPGAGTPPITDRTIRHWLNVPRRRLLITDGGTILLESPAPIGGGTQVVDAHNGPRIDVFSIQSVIGEARTYVVNFQFTTYINECQSAELKSFIPAVLSNRFSQTHSLDEDYNLNITTEGVAHFRSDVVQGRNPINGLPFVARSPDIFRRAFFLPIPNGFKRTINYIHGREDSTVLDYQFTDIQTPMAFVAGDSANATRIEVVYSEAISNSGDTLNLAIGAMEDVYNFRWMRRATGDKSSAAESATLASSLDKLSSTLDKHLGKKP